MKPLVSVLMPVYNHERYVYQAIMSVLTQTYTNIELIVLNDGSTDKSELIIKKLLEEYRFEYIYQDNKGLVKTLNTLKLLAKGKYVSIIASDDYFHSRKIEKLVSFMEINDSALVYSNMYLVDDNSKVVGSIKDGGYSGYIFEKILFGDFFINSITTLIRKDIYDNFTYSDCYIEDYQMWLKIASKYPIGYYDGYLSYYRIGNPTSLSSNLIKMQQAEYEIISEYKDLKNFNDVIDTWNMRWFSSFSKCNKAYAVNKFLFKILKKENLFKLNFYKSLLKILIPCFMYKLRK